MFHIKTLCHPGAEGDRVHRKGEGEASPWFALRCSPPPRLRGHPLTPPASQKNYQLLIFDSRLDIYYRYGKR